VSLLLPIPQCRQAKKFVGIEIDFSVATTTTTTKKRDGTGVEWGSFKIGLFAAVGNFCDYKRMGEKAKMESLHWPALPSRSLLT